MDSQQIMSIVNQVESNQQDPFNFGVGKQQSKLES